MKAQNSDISAILALKAARAVLGMTQDEVAKASGVSKPTVARLEAMLGKTNLSTIVALLSVYRERGWKSATSLRGMSRYKSLRRRWSLLCRASMIPDVVVLIIRPERIVAVARLSLSGYPYRGRILRYPGSLASDHRR